MTYDKSAVTSECGKYRYRLDRKWADRPSLTWMLLNPSTADAYEDDPTITRCVGYAKKWGFGGIIVVNLFALRATDPLVMMRTRNPIGRGNITHILDVLRTNGNLIVCGWGRHGSFQKVDIAMWHGLRKKTKRKVKFCCLKVNSDGSPAHPLYQPKDAVRIPWAPPPHRLRNRRGAAQ